MPDPRFFRASAPLTLGEAAQIAGAEVRGAGALSITEAAPLARAGVGSIAFLADRRRRADLASSRAGAVLIAPAHADWVPDGSIALITSAPHAAWSAIARKLHQPILSDASSAVSSQVQLEEGVIVGPGAIIAAGASIGARTRIHPGAIIGPGVCVGRDCEIGAGASIGFALIGDRVSIAAGARIGEAGFGVAGDGGVPVDVPQLGRVIIQDNVTIGANSCVDRGSWDDTVIGENSKLDNLVHIAHNVRMGRNCRLAAYTGISGSVTIGDGVLFGGRSGVADQLTVGEGAAVGAAAGVFKSIPAREVWTGYPARPMRRWLREQAALASLSRKGKTTGDEQDD